MCRRRGQARIPDNPDKKKEEIRADLTFIRKENTVFTFFSAASAPDFSNYKQAIYRAINSFKPLKSSEHLNRQPLRIFLKKVNRPQSLRYFLQDMGVPAQNWDKIVLINAMELDQQLAADRLVKIIE